MLAAGGSGGTRATTPGKQELAVITNYELVARIVEVVNNLPAASRSCSKDKAYSYLLSYSTGAAMLDGPAAETAGARMRVAVGKESAHGKDIAAAKSAAAAKAREARKHASDAPDLERELAEIAFGLAKKTAGLRAQPYEDKSGSAKRAREEPTAPHPPPPAKPTPPSPAIATEPGTRPLFLESAEYQRGFRAAQKQIEREEEHYYRRNLTRGGSGADARDAGASYDDLVEIVDMLQRAVCFARRSLGYIADTGWSSYVQGEGEIARLEHALAHAEWRMYYDPEWRTEPDEDCPLPPVRPVVAESVRPRGFRPEEYDCLAHVSTENMATLRARLEYPSANFSLEMERTLPVAINTLPLW